MSVRERPRGDGTFYWQVRFREDGKERSVSWDTEADAEKFDALVKKLGPAKARDICRIVDSPTKSITLRTWLDKHNDTLTGIEAGTLARYKAYVTNDIGPALGDIPLAALSRDDIARWINDMSADGASGKTVANKHGYLAGALNAAVITGQIKTNPCDGNRLPRWDREEMVFLTHDEFQLLLNEVTEYWRPLVQFLVASGCRWSEASALRPADVDRSTGTVRITKAWKTGAGGYVLGVPKTKKSVRTINLPPDALTDLDYRGEWLFTNSGRGRAGDTGPVRIHSFSPNVWRPAIKRAREKGLTKSPRIHDLRHTCASWLIQAGIPLPVVQQHLGHESITTTVQVYGHLDRRSAEAAAAAIGKALQRD